MSKIPTRSQTRTSPLSEQPSQLRGRQDHPQRVGDERNKAEGSIKSRTAGHRLGIAAVKNIEDDNRDTNRPFHFGDAREAIYQKVTPLPLSLIAAIDANHRDKGCGNFSMAGTVAGIALRQVGIIDGERIERIEADHLTLAACEHEGSQIAGSIKLVGGLAEEIIDLPYPARKVFTIVARNIKWLRQIGWHGTVTALLIGKPSFVASYRIEQRRRWCSRIVESIEKGLMIGRIEHHPLMSLDRFNGSLVGGVDCKNGIVHASKGSGSLDRSLHMRLRSEVHPSGAALTKSRRSIFKGLHGEAPSTHRQRFLYIQSAYKSIHKCGLRMGLVVGVRSHLTALALCLAASATPAHASKCEAGTIFNPITKVRWSCIFPITIGGVRVGSYDKLDKALDAQSTSSPLCACRKGATFWFGLKVSFWSPNRMVDVVTEPGCMMALGADIMSTGGKLQGSQSSIADGTNTNKLFAQMHYYISPVWKMLDMFTDLPCFQDDGFDVALMTEVLATWQSGTLAEIIQPEGILFGNPAAGLACMADSAASAAGTTLDPLFWCMGAWGNTYPVAGDIHYDDSVEAWAGLASRGIFMMGRLGLLTISSSDGCSFKPQPIWTKSRYKLQLMEPVKGGKCVNIGRPGSLWTSAKHAPGKDNAQFMVFEKNICCAGVSAP